MFKVSWFSLFKFSGITFDEAVLDGLDEDRLGGIIFVDDQLECEGAFGDALLQLGRGIRQRDVRIADRPDTCSHM